MHEMGIAQEVAKIAEEEARTAKALRVTRLRLRVGRWSGVEVESLRFSLDVLAEGTMLEGCEWVIETVEPTFSCSTCDATYSATTYFDPCPACGGTGAEMIEGDELTLAELEVED